MNMKRLDEIIKRMDKFRDTFTDIGAFNLAADFRDVYMILMEKRDKLQVECCSECGKQKE